MLNVRSNKGRVLKHCEDFEVKYGFKCNWFYSILLWKDTVGCSINLLITLERNNRVMKITFNVNTRIRFLQYTIQCAYAAFKNTCRLAERKHFYLIKFVTTLPRVRIL